jgi:hypothetical protein
MIIANSTNSTIIYSSVSESSELRSLRVQPQDLTSDTLVIQYDALMELIRGLRIAEVLLRVGNSDEKQTAIE